MEKHIRYWFNHHRQKGEQEDHQTKMTKKKGSTMTVWPPLKVVVLLCAILLTLALLLFHSDEFKLIQSSNFAYQFKNNGLGHSHGFQSPPKIAFLFLTRRKLPLDFLWANFFEVFSYISLFYCLVSTLYVFDCRFFS